RLIARAALGVSGLWALKYTASATDRALIGPLEEALRVLGDEDSVLRTKVASRLALKLALAGARDRGTTLSADAVAMARRVGDQSTLAYALSARHAVLMAPDHLDERLATATEVLALADAMNDAEIALRGHSLRLYDVLEMGDMA